MPTFERILPSIGGVAPIALIVRRQTIKSVDGRMLISYIADYSTRPGRYRPLSIGRCLTYGTRSQGGACLSQHGTGSVSQLRGHIALGSERTSIMIIVFFPLRAGYCLVALVLTYYIEFQLKLSRVIRPRKISWPHYI